LNDAGITSNDPREVINHPAIDRACQPLALQALAHFKAADTIMDRNPRRLVRAPRIMSRYYNAIYRKLLARGFTAPRAPVKLSKAAKLSILMRYAFI
jgi:phytoene synthase